MPGQEDSRMLAIYELGVLANRDLIAQCGTNNSGFLERLCLRQVGVKSSWSTSDDHAVKDGTHTMKI